MRSVVAQRHKVRSPLEEMKYLLKFIFPFLRSGVEVQRGVEFCHSTRNASRIRQKGGNGVLNARFPLPTLLCAGYSVKLTNKSSNTIIGISLETHNKTSNIV